jgi:hypothetical protein
MAVPASSSLERLLGLLEAHNPHWLALLQAQTEAEFIEATDGVIERAASTIENGAKQYAMLNERGLSLLLADFLNLAGFHATAERYINGHVDVVVEHQFGGSWKYLGECKIYNGYQYHVDGCKQVLGYCTGREHRAFCLDFFKVAAMYDKLQQLRIDIDTNLPLEQDGASIGHFIKGAFVTSHRHQTGSVVELLHAGCSVVTS